MYKLKIEADVICPVTNDYSPLQLCATCDYFVELDDGEYVVCKYDAME